MGWCRGTEYFDIAIEMLLTDFTLEKKIEILIKTFENGDWDCQDESEYYDHPMVNEVFRKLHPKWFQEEQK